ncbi:unnamed protein product [Adineta steineri]|uniref:Uncharacterized protein n=1 Tax=Adineta steineri TaxID=433720 RepID=A0A815FIA1_9BILA|nr:unnamed protein product [Adineta steineri]CAF1325641.1 unnamed protein product [Adineta steineri]
MPGAINAGICGFKHLTCSQFVPCTSPNNVCYEPGYICVHHPLCHTHPICYPLSMAGEPFCPAITICGNHSKLLTFDDLTPKFAIQNGYNGINWDNSAVQLSNNARSGYTTATVSGNVTSHNVNGFPMTMRSANGALFTLNSAAVAAAWRDNLQLTVVGYRSNAVIASDTFIVQVFTVSYITFNGYSGLDTAIFSTLGGTVNPNTIGSNGGTHFAMDNLCLSFP